MQKVFNPENTIVSRFELFCEKLAICGKILTSNSSFFCTFKEVNNGKKNTDVRAVNIDPKEIHDTAGDIYIRTFDVFNPSIVKEFQKADS